MLTDNKNFDIRKFTQVKPRPEGAVRLGAIDSNGASSSGAGNRVVDPPVVDVIEATIVKNGPQQRFFRTSWTTQFPCIISEVRNVKRGDELYPVEYIVCTTCRDHGVPPGVYGEGTSVMKHANIMKHMASEPHKKATRLQLSKQMPQPTMPEVRVALLGQQQKQAMVKLRTAAAILKKGLAFRMYVLALLYPLAVLIIIEIIHVVLHVGTSYMRSSCSKVYS